MVAADGLNDDDVDVDVDVDVEKNGKTGRMAAGLAGEEAEFSGTTLTIGLWSDIVVDIVCSAVLQPIENE